MNKILLLVLVCYFTASCIEDIGVGSGLSVPPKEEEKANVNLTGKVKEVSFSQSGNSTIFSFNYDSLGKDISEITITKGAETVKVKPFYTSTGSVDYYQSNGQTYAKLLYEKNNLTQIKTPTITETFIYDPANRLSTYRYDSQAERKIFDFRWVANTLIQVILKGTVNNDESIVKETEQQNPLKEFFIRNLGVIPFNYTLINNNLVTEEAFVFKGLTFKYDYQFEGKKLITIKKQSVQINNNLKTEEEIKVGYY